MPGHCETACSSESVSSSSPLTIMSPHDSSSIVPATPSSTRSNLCLIDLDCGPHVSSPHLTPKEAPYPSEYACEEISDLNDLDPEDDLSPLLNALTVSSIKYYAYSSHLFPTVTVLPDDPNSSRFYRSYRTPAPSSCQAQGCTTQVRACRCCREAGIVGNKSVSLPSPACKTRIGCCKCLYQPC